MLILIEELRAMFARLTEEDFGALMALGLIDKYTTEASAKVLAHTLRRDDAVRLPRAAMWIAAQDEAKAAGDKEWYLIGDDEFTVLDDRDCDRMVVVHRFPNE